MINFLNLIRPSAPASPAAQQAGSGAAGQPVNLFAAIVQKLLSDLAGGGAMSAPAATAGQTFSGFGTKGLTPGNVETGASVMEQEPRPMKSRSKEGTEDAPAVMLVPPSELMQVANLLPVPAAGAGVAAPLAESGTAGGSGDASDATGGAASGLSGGTTPPAAPGGAPQQVNFAQPFNSLQTDGEMLISLLKEIPPGANRVPGSPGFPAMPAEVENSGPPAGLEREFLPGQAVQPDRSVTSQVQPEMSGPDRVASLLPGTPKPPVADVGGLLRPELKIQSPDQVPVADPLNDTAASQTPQVQSQSPAQVVMTAPVTEAAGSVDPSVVLRAASVQTRKAGDDGTRTTSDSRDAESGPVTADPPSPGTGFFTGVVRDMLGIISKAGAQSAPADAREDGSASVPAAKNDGSRGDSVTAFADVQAQPAKKAADGAAPDSGSVTPADVNHQVHEQADLSILRSSQAALNNPATPDKPESATAAAPLRDLPSPYAPLPPEVSRRIADQVVQNLKLQVDGSTSDIRMTLKPPSLGEVQLTIHVEDARMQAQIDVSQQVVKAALEAHMPQLRQALQEHGIEVQRIDVMLPEQSLQRDGTGANGDRAGRRGARRMLSADDADPRLGTKDMGYNTIELIM